MNRLAVECSADGDAIALVANGLIRRVEEVHLPEGVVIQRQLGAWRIFLGALWQLGGGFVWRTIIDDDAGPRSGLCHVALRCQREVSGEKNQHQERQEEFRHCVDSSRGKARILNFELLGQDT